ncbi:Periplasmic beta-glucosidase precursor [compost metagenome]
MLNAGESKTISFTIDKEKLSFYNQQLKWGAEPGDFKLMIGTASNNIKLEKDFTLTD